MVGWSPEESEYMRWNASGPLVTSIMALLGNDSWIRTAVDLTSSQANSSDDTAPVPAWWRPFCERQPMYHSNFTQCESDGKPSETVAQWFAAFFGEEGSATSLEQLIFIGVALTNKAVLMTHRDRQAPRSLSRASGRTIFSSPGFLILKPNLSLASIVAISVILAVQVAGLLYCSVYIARTPTWTRVFNAMAIARIGAGLEKGKLPVDGQYAEDEDYENLRAVDVPLTMASAGAIRRRTRKDADIEREGKSKKDGRIFV